MLSLQPELVIKILGHLDPRKDGSNKHAISACCRVSKFLLEPARDVLYRQVTVAVSTSLVAPQATSRFEQRRPYQMFFEIIEDPNYDRTPCIAWSLHASSSVETILAHPHLATRASTIVVNLERSIHNIAVPLSRQNPSAGLMKPPAAAKRIGELVERILQACPLVREIRMATGHAHSIQSLISGINLGSHDISHLSFHVNGSRDKLAPPIAAVCQCLPGLKHLSIRGLVAEHNNWKWYGTAPFRLETPVLEDTFQTFSHFVQGSATSLTTLRLLGRVPTRPLDLSSFGSLREVMVDCDENEERSADWHEQPAALWIPPAPSQLSYAHLSPLSIHIAKILEIPTSLQHLTL